MRKLRITAVTTIVMAVITPGPECAGMDTVNLPRPKYTPPAAKIDTLRLTDFQVRKLKKNEPAVNHKTYIAEIAMGTVSGAGLGFASLIVIGGEEGGLAAGILGMAAGYTLGSALGVYTVGTSGDQTGSFTSTLTGAVVGALLSAWVFGSNNEVAQTLEWGSLILPPTGGTIGFNLSRRSRLPAQAGPSRYPGLTRYQTAEAGYVEMISLRF